MKSACTTLEAVGQLDYSKPPSQEQNERRHMKKPGTDPSHLSSADRTSASSCLCCGLSSAVPSQEALEKAPSETETAKQWPVGHTYLLDFM